MNGDITGKARARAREILAASPTFLGMPHSEQLAMYQEVVSNQERELSSPNSSSLPARALGGASDDIDDARHLNPRIDQAGQLAGEFIDEVDFPQFVADLLEGVFDAGLNVTLQTMSSYQELLKTASQSSASFVKAIGDVEAFGALAEEAPEEFSFDFGDEDESGERPPVLTDKEGNVVATGGQDIGDNEVKVRLMDAKIRMAQEQRAILRETILMGVSRLVIEKGVVQASVLFDVKAGESIGKKDKAGRSYSRASTREAKASGGLLGKVIGGPAGSFTTTSRKSKISVSSAKSQSDTELAAKVAGSVSIEFKSDYFKLDNFASMYAPPTAEEREAAGGSNGTGAP